MRDTASSSLNKQTAVIIYSNIVVFFDFLIYLYLVNTLSAVFFPLTENPMLAKIQVFGIFAAGYLARPIGGLFIGRFGDIKGRKPAFIVTSTFIVITSLITACLPTYAQVGLLSPVLFVLVRLAQGIGFGAHSVLGWVYISEHVPNKKLGLYISIISASFLAGTLLTTIVFKLIFATVSPDVLIAYGWRLLFIGSAVCVAMGLFLSRYLAETPFFLNKQIVDTYIPNYRDIDLSYDRFHAIFLSTLFSFQLASLTIVINLSLPNLILLKFSVDSSLLSSAHFIGMIFFIIGTLFYGKLADRGNIGRALMIGSVFTAIQALIFYYTLEHTSTNYMLITYAMLGFSAGIIALAPIIMLQLFPTRGRLTSVAVIYNITYGILGGLLPIALVYATSYIAFSPALYLVFVSIVGFITGQYIYQVPKSSYLDDTLLSYSGTDN